MNESVRERDIWNVPQRLPNISWERDVLSTIERVRGFAQGVGAIPSCFILVDEGAYFRNHPLGSFTDVAHWRDFSNGSCMLCSHWDMH